jgi:hypothetical protein
LGFAVLDMAVLLVPRSPKRKHVTPKLAPVIVLFLNGLLTTITINIALFPTAMVLHVCLNPFGMVSALQPAVGVFAAFTALF